MAARAIITASASAQTVQLIPVDSIEGNKILNRAYEAKSINNRVFESFEKQDNDFSCALSSLLLVLNAIDVAYRVKYSNIVGDKLKEDEFYRQHENGVRFNLVKNDLIQHKVIKEYLEKISYEDVGANLQQLQNVTMQLGFGSNAYYACTKKTCTDDVSEKLKKTLMRNMEYYLIDSVVEFRKFVRDRLMRPVTGLIVNYEISALGYERTASRFSPIAAYDVEADTFLLLDTYSVPIWVKSEDLFNALTPIDETSHLPRGILHVHELLY